MDSPYVIGSIVVVVALLIYVIVTRNKLVRLRNAVEAAWAQIDVQLARRHELIPNLVETVKGYLTHERQTLEAVVAARTAALAATGPAAQADAENTLTQALKSLFAVAEAHPDLKASSNFQSLQEELATSENRIAYARQYYNDATLTYHNAIHMIPASLVARASGLFDREYFEAGPGQQGPVQVRFDTGE